MQQMREIIVLILKISLEFYIMLWLTDDTGSDLKESVIPEPTSIWVYPSVKSQGNEVHFLGMIDV